MFLMDFSNGVCAAADEGKDWSSREDIPLISHSYRLELFSDSRTSPSYCVAGLCYAFPTSCAIVGIVSFKSDCFYSSASLDPGSPLTSRSSCSFARPSIHIQPLVSGNEFRLLKGSDILERLLSTSSSWRTSRTTLSGPRAKGSSSGDSWS